MQQFTIIYPAESKDQSLQIMKICLKENISFEFMNGNEFYFFIYDLEDFNRKQKALSKKVISESNKAN